MRVLALSGSLPLASSNRALLRALGALAPDDVEVVAAPGIDSLPYFNPEVDPAPASVDAFRSAIGDADAVVLASPEYAHSLPGALKNALDWVVGSGELYDKAVVVLCGSPRPDGGVRGRAALEQTLRAQGSRVLMSETVPLARGAEASNPLLSETATRILREALARIQADVVHPDVEGAPRP
jgi:chromate reductase